MPETKAAVEDDPTSSMLLDMEDSHYAPPEEVGRRGSLAYSLARRMSRGPSGEEPAETYDIDPASRSEIRAWYLYDWSNGPFFYVALPFFQVLINDMALNIALRKGGYWTDDCLVSYPGNTTAAENARLDNCARIPFDPIISGGIDYGALSGYCTSISVALQLLVFLTLSSYADWGDMRKRLLVMSNTGGALLTICALLVVNDDLVWFACVFLIFSNVLYGTAAVFYNAYLPLLVANHYEVDEVVKQADSTDAEIFQKVQEKSAEMSSLGLAVGYTGQMIFLVIGAGILTAGASLQLFIALGGVWSMGFAAITFYYLKTRPGPKLPEGESYLRRSVQQIKHTFASRHKLKQLFVFLLAYFIYSDGSTTIAASSITFAQLELDPPFKAENILILLIIVSLCAAIGGIFFMKLEKSGYLSPRGILFVNLVCISVIPIYGMIALKTHAEFYALTMLFGLNTGALQAFTRDLYTKMLPKGHEAEYFGFFEVTDKGTAWLGPLTVSVVRQLTGDFRLAFVSVVFFIVVGGFVLIFVDVDLAIKQKIAFEQEEAQAAKAGDLNVVREDSTQ